MAETSSSPQAGGAGSSRNLAQRHLPPASMIRYDASSAPPKSNISKRRRNEIDATRRHPAARECPLRRRAGLRLDWTANDNNVVRHSIRFLRPRVQLLAAEGEPG